MKRQYVNYEGTAMKLVDSKTGRELKIGTKVKSFRGETMVLTGGQPPHKPESTGRIYVSDDGTDRSYFPGVIGAEWRPV